VTEYGPAAFVREARVAENFRLDVECAVIKDDAMPSRTCGFSSRLPETPLFAWARIRKRTCHAMPSVRVRVALSRHTGLRVAPAQPGHRAVGRGAVRDLQRGSRRSPDLVARPRTQSYAPRRHNSRLSIAGPCAVSHRSQTRPATGRFWCASATRATRVAIRPLSSAYGPSGVQ
jgi:hypothetical protein